MTSDDLTFTFILFNYKTLLFQVSRAEYISAMRLANDGASVQPILLRKMLTISCVPTPAPNEDVSEHKDVLEKSLSNAQISLLKGLIKISEAHRRLFYKGVLTCY